MDESNDLVTASDDSVAESDDLVLDCYFIKRLR